MGTKTKSFSSTMTGVPVLSGTAGALIAVLDAVLVNGFGAQVASSVVVTGTTALVTLPTTPAAQVDSVILVSGATPAGLNGEQRVTAVGANTVSFTTAVAAGSATGTITVKVASAGWTKQFTGTNLAVYKMGAVEGTGCVLRVDDTGTTVARVRGYEAMTDVNTGTGPFPSLVQYADAGMWWGKSNAADTASRTWRIVADDRGVFLFARVSSSFESHSFYFGDVLSLKSNDPYACVLKGNTASRVGVVPGTNGDDLVYSDSSQNVPNTLYFARAANTLGGSVPGFTATTESVGLALAHVTGASGWPYPSPVDNGLMLAPMMAYAATTGYRGYLPGIYTSPQITNTAFSTGDTVAGSGALVGKRVMAVKCGSLTSVSSGVLFIDTISDWRA